MLSFLPDRERFYHQNPVFSALLLPLSSATLSDQAFLRHKCRRQPPYLARLRGSSSHRCSL